MLIKFLKHSNINKNPDTFAWGNVDDYSVDTVQRNDKVVRVLSVVFLGDKPKKEIDIAEIEDKMTKKLYQGIFVVGENGSTIDRLL